MCKFKHENHHDMAIVLLDIELHPFLTSTTIKECDRIFYHWCKEKGDQHVVNEID